MQLTPRMTLALRQKVFNFEEAMKVQWAIDLYETAPPGTEIDYSPDMTRLLERLYRWLDSRQTAQLALDSTEFA